MQTRQFPIQKKIWLLPFALAIMTLMVFSTCKGKKANEPTCVKLTKKQIEKWVKGGYTDPAGANYIASVEFHTAYADPGNVFRVFAIGKNSKGEFINETLTELTAVDSCSKSHIHLKQFIFIGTIPATLDELGILKGGKVPDSLTYLRMAPYTAVDPYSKYDMLEYKPYVHNTDGISKTMMSRSYLPPCPPCPNCKGPCPPPSACPPGCVDKTIEKPAETATDKPIDSAAHQ